MTERKIGECDSTVKEIPAPDYYIIRHKSGLHHLADPSEAAPPVRGDAITTRCGLTIAADEATHIMHLTDWLDVDEILEYYKNDEAVDALWNGLEPFGGQCQNCLSSHEAEGAEDFTPMSLE